MAMHPHSIPSMLVLALLLLLLLPLTVAQPAPKGDWAEQDTSEDLAAAFGNQSYSWDAGENWNICKRFEIELPMTLTVSDYGLVISKGLHFLHVAGGGSLILGEGDFVLKSTIKFPSNVCLRGKGIGKTVLKVVSGTDGKYPGSGVLRSQYSANVTVHDLSIDGGMNIEKYESSPVVAKYGVYFKLVNFAWLKDVGVRRFAGYGVLMRGELSRWMFHVAIESCASDGNGVDGFRLSQTHYAALVNSSAAYNGRHGCYVSEGATDTIVKRCSFVDNGALSGAGCGVAIRESGGLQPRSLYAWKNNITNAFHAGVCMSGATDIALDRTRIVNRRDRNAYCFDVPQASFLETNGVCNLRSKTEYRVYPIEGMGSKCPDRGIKESKYCCPRSCRRCGGKGCGDRGPNETCCTGAIKKMDRPCSKFSPPCKL